MMTGLVATLGALGIIATLLPLVRRDAWWIRVFDFPRLQVAVLLAACLLFFMLLARPLDAADIVYAVALGACLLYQCWTMLPYTRLVDVQTLRAERHEPRHAVRLMFANVLMTNRNAGDLLRLVHEVDPDVLLTLEVDEWWASQLSALQAGYPHVLSAPLPNTYGMVLYSRLEFVESRIEYLIDDDVPSMHVRVRLPSGPEITLHCVHPRPPVPGQSDRSTERDVELLVIGRRVKKEAGPVVVMGDLNDVAWSHTSRMFRRLSGLLDPRVGRGFYNSFHTAYPIVRFPLDHFFHTNDLRLIDFRRLESFGSDHFPVYIALSYEPAGESAQPEPQPKAGDHEEAAQSVREL